MENPEPLVVLAGAAFLLVVVFLFLRMSSHGSHALKDAVSSLRRNSWHVNRPLFRADAKVWSEVALRLGAELLTTGHHHRVRFRWQGRDAIIYEGDPVCFEVSGVDLGAFRGELFLGSSAGRRLGGFLQHVSIAEGDEGELRELLSPPLGQLLRDLLVAGGVGIKIRDGLCITARLRRDPSAILRFSIICLKFAQHLKMFAGKSRGIHVIESQTSYQGECQICGAVLEGRLVRCARCSTPHHADCWGYTGMCSTYGCGERVFLT